MIQAIEAKTHVSVMSLLQSYAHYNQWANRQLVDWLRTKPAELLDQPVPSSFPSLRKTLVHINNTQAFWLAAVQQTERVFTANEAEPEPKSLEEVLASLVSQSEELAHYVGSLTDASLAEGCSLSTPWFDSHQPRFEFIHHCLNHSTYHRGQLVTIGRNLGFTDAPMTDYNFYLLMA